MNTDNNITEIVQRDSDTLNLNTSNTKINPPIYIYQECKNRDCECGVCDYCVTSDL